MKDKLITRLMGAILKYANRNKVRVNPNPRPIPIMGIGYQPTISLMPEWKPPRTGSPVQKTKNSIDVNDNMEKSNVAMFIKSNKLLTNEASSNKLAKIYNSISSGMIEVDTDIKIIFVNMDTGEIISEI